MNPRSEHLLTSVGLMVDCDPPIVEPGHHVFITLFDTSNPTGELLSGVNVVVRSSSDHSVPYQYGPHLGDTAALSTLSLFINDLFPYGSYDVIASYPDTDTSSVVGFTVAKPGFADSLGAFREATSVHSQAISLGFRGDLATAFSLLQQVAETYSSLGCYDAAVLCYQDIATLSHEANNHLVAKGAVQRGLLNALAGSCDRATSEDEVFLDDAPPDDVSLERLRIEPWQINELTATAAWIDPSIVPLIASDPLSSTLTTLLALKERHPFLISLLVKGLSSPRYHKLCSAGLTRSQVEPTLPRRLEIMNHAESESEIGRMLLQGVLRLSDRDQLFQQLVALLNMLSPGGQQCFLRALFTVWPTRCVEVGDELRLYTEAGTLITCFPNSGLAVRAIAASVSSTSFADLKMRVMKVGA